MSCTRIVPPPVIACAPIRQNWCTAGKPAEDHPVAELDMPAKRGVVGEDGVVADPAVMRDVDVGHDPVVGADPGHAAVLRRADVEGAELADGVAVADLQPVSARLRISCPAAASPERTKWKDAVVAADRGVARDSTACGADRGAGADLDMLRADDRVRADLDVVRQLGRDRPAPSDGRGRSGCRRASSCRHLPRWPGSVA